MDKETSFQPGIFSQISHELRIPLAGILGMVYFLNQTSLNAQQKGYLNAILASAQQLADVEAKLYATMTTTMPENSNKILLVENEIMARKVHLSLLQEMGYTPDIAENGEQALNMVQNNHYDLILMNIGLPDIDGIEVSTQIRALEKDKRAVIVVLTIFPLEEVEEECMSADIDKVIAKPTNTHVLQAVVTEFIA